VTEALGLRSSAEKAAEIFGIFGGTPPDLIDIGIPPLTRTVGKFFPGTLVCVAMSTGVGKTNLAMSMLNLSADRGGYISTEDPEDVIGSRILADATGISSLRLRRNDLTDSERLRCKTVIMTLREGTGPQLRYKIGATLEEVEDTVKDLAEAGARFAILDYLQKIRGDGEDRRNEVNRTMSRFQRACAHHKMVPIVISQLQRMERTKPPALHNLKESGDIENECRCIVLGHIDGANERKLWLRVAKSTFGGAGARFAYLYDDAGTLRPEGAAGPQIPGRDEDFDDE
jgi:replicative DNA helicase